MVAIVQRSLLLWLPGPSVTQLPLLESWQYALPLVISHHVEEPAEGDEDWGGGIGADGGGCTSLQQPAQSHPTAWL